MSEATSPTRASDPGGQSRRVVTAILARLEHGQLEVVEGSRLERFGVREEGGLLASMTINDPSVWSAMLLRGGVGLGEAYFEGA
ncbi:MAG TPA: hypothetical protein VGR61_00725, partial [Candidatus Dormibacteraeota bacterium]|nr:hypothetical protein [Candidatus Dormibacteraeota bacterium]